MNKISLYILLLILYLGLAKSFSPAEKDIPYINSARQFASIFEDSPTSVLLLNSYKKGFLVKTYVQKVRVIYSYRPAEEFHIRTNYENWKSQKKYHNYSVFRRFENTPQVEAFPLPPGVIFVGNSTYGKWSYLASGKKVWVFHPPYEQLRVDLGWPDSFNFSEELYRKINIHRQTGTEFITEDIYSQNKNFDTTSPLNLYIGDLSLEGFKNHMAPFFTSPWKNKKGIRK